MFDVTVTVAGQPAGIADHFPRWREHDRFGIGIPLGDLGVTDLIEVAITSVCDAGKIRRARRGICPAIHAFPVDRRQGGHAPSDVRRLRLEKTVVGVPRDLRSRRRCALRSARACRSPRGGPRP